MGFVPVREPLTLLICALAVVPLLLLACAHGSVDGVEPEQVVVSDFTLTPIPDNALGFIATWDTPDPVKGRVEYYMSTDPGVVMTTPEESVPTTSHRVVVVGLQEHTVYHFTPVSDGAPGAEYSGLTGVIPSDFPRPALTVADTVPEGFTIVGLAYPMAAVVAVDPGGKIVWYHRDKDGGDPAAFHVLPDGRLAYNIYDAIKAVDYEGNEETLADVRAYGDVSHHDFLVTPEGNYMYLSRESYMANGGLWCLDRIMERDPSGTVVWDWNVSDHIADLGGYNITNTYQREFTPDCGLDLTHANSVQLLTDESGASFVLVSFRNLNSIVKISYATRQVVWVFGQGQDFTVRSYEDDPFSWRYQHSARLIGDSSLVFFDNGNQRKDDASNYSRVMKFVVDEAARTAALDWTHDFAAYASHAGNVDDNGGGGYLVTFPTNSNSFGGFIPNTYSALVELDTDADVVWKVDFVYPSTSDGNSIFGNLRVGSLYSLTDN